MIKYNLSFLRYGTWNNLTFWNNVAHDCDMGDNRCINMTLLTFLSINLYIKSSIQNVFSFPRLLATG